MTRDIKTLIAVGLSILSLFILSGCNSEAEEEYTEAEQEATEKRVVSIEATIIEASDLDITKTFSGALTGGQQADIRAKLSEAVVKIDQPEGSIVEANQTIISLDPDGPSSGLASARSVYLNSEKNYNKMANLYQEGAISESSYDQAKLAYEVDFANYDVWRQLVGIKSPFAGVVTSVDVAVGEYVSEGQKVATVASVSELRLTFAVNSGEISLFDRGAELRISSDLSDHTATGQVLSSAGSANPDTRAFEVEAIIDNTEGHFRPGMFVHVEYLAARLEGAIVIDRSSIIILDDIPVAFAVKQGVAQRRELLLGQTVAGRQVVSSGLAVGDTLVTIGQAYLNDGTQVHVARVNGR